MTQKDMKLLLEIQTKTGNSASALQQLIALMKQIALAAKESTEIPGIDKVLKELDILEKSLQEVSNSADKVSSSSQGAGKELQTIASGSTIENLERVADSFKNISDYLVDFIVPEEFKDLKVNAVDAASAFEDLRIRMENLFKGNTEKAKEMSDWITGAAEKTPYQLEEITDVVVRLETYGLEAQETFLKLGDMAAFFTKDLGTTMESIVDAQTGEFTRLKENFGITKDFLNQKAKDFYGKTFADAKGQITDIKVLNDTLFRYMEENYAGSMERLSKSFTGAMSNFQDTLTQLSASVGEEILPKLTEFIKYLTGLVKWFNDVDPTFKKVIANFALVGSAVGIIASGLASAGLKIAAFSASLKELIVTQTAAAASSQTFATSQQSICYATGMVTKSVQETAKATAASSKSMSLQITSWRTLWIPIIGGVALAIGAIGTAIADAQYEMNKAKSDQLVEESQKVAEGFLNIKDAIEQINKTPLQIAIEKSPEQLQKEIEAAEIALKSALETKIQELGQEGIEYKYTLKEKTGGVVETPASPYASMPAGVFTKEKFENVEHVEKIDVAYSNLTKRLEELQQQMKNSKSTNIETVMEYNSIKEALAGLEDKTHELGSEMDGLFNKNEGIIDANTKALDTYTQLTVKLQETAKGFNDSVLAINESKAALESYLSEIEARSANKEKLLYIAKAVDQELSAGKDLQKIYEDLGVSTKELEALFSESTSTSKEAIEGQIDALNHLVQAEEYTLDKKREILSQMLEDETLTAEARQKIYDEIEKTEKERWENFETEQKTALAKGEITERQYWENVGKYLKDNEKNLGDSNELKTELTREYYEGIKKLGEKDVQDEEKRLHEKEKAFKDHLNRLKDLQDIGEISPEKRLKELEKILKTEKLTEEQRIEVKKEALEVEEQIAEEKEKLAEEEAERQKANLQLQIETLEEEGKISEAKKLRLEAEVEEKRQAGLDEVTIENWKNAQLAKIDRERIEQNKKVDQEILAQKKESIQEEIQYIENKTEQIAEKTGNRVAAEREAHGQIMALEREQTDLIIQEYDKRIDEIHKQAEEYEKAGTDRVKVEEFVAESIKDLQLEVLNDFLEKEEQKRKEIEATAKTIEDIDKKLAENRAKQAELEGSYFDKGPSPLMSMEEAFNLPKDESGKITHLDPIVARWDELKKTKEEEKSLMEERATAVEKEKMLQEELKAIEDERLKVQTEFNEKLKETESIYGNISAASPWAGEIASVDSYMLKLDELQAKLQETAGAGGGEGRTEGDIYEGEEPSSGGGGGSSSGGSSGGSGGEEGYNYGSESEGYYNLPEGQGRSETGWVRESHDTTHNTYNINIGDKQIESNGQFGSAVDSISQISDLALKYWT